MAKVMEWDEFKAWDNLPLVDQAEANIRADYSNGNITKEQFQKEMLVTARYRAQQKPATQ